MKKIMALILMALVMCSMAFAKGGNDNSVSVKSEAVQGLMIQARNQTHAQHMESVMEMVQDRHRAKLSQLDDLEVSEICNDGCKVVATGSGKAKLFWAFEMKKTYRYQVEEDGEVKLQKRFYDYLWKFN